MDFFWGWVDKRGVTTRRAPGQRLMNLSVKEDFLQKLDAFLEENSLGGRSQFMRDAVREKVNRVLETEIITREMAAPPGRAGKGGRKPIKYPALDSAASALNDASSAAKVKAAADKATADAKKVQPAKRKG